MSTPSFLLLNLASAATLTSQNQKRFNVKTPGRQEIYKILASWRLCVKVLAQCTRNQRVSTYYESYLDCAKHLQYPTDSFFFLIRCSLSLAWLVGGTKHINSSLLPSPPPLWYNSDYEK